MLNGYRPGFCRLLNQSDQCWMIGTPMLYRGAFSEFYRPMFLIINSRCVGSVGYIRHNCCIGHMPVTHHACPKSAYFFLNRIQRSEEHTSELQSRGHLVCRLLLEKKKRTN